MLRLPIASMLLPLLLGACLSGGDREPTRRSLPRGLGPAQSALPDDRETRQCAARLEAAAIGHRLLPDRRFDGGCSAVGAVQLLEIGTPVTNLGAMRCGLAERFAAWVRYGVQPAARLHLGAEVAKVESFGTYSCRGTVGNGAATRLSEHGVANAVDVAAFVLADGRRISVLGDWQGGDEQVRAFLRTVHRSACKRFATVLGPDYNAAHRNHFHFDQGRGPFCR